MDGWLIWIQILLHGYEIVSILVLNGWLVNSFVGGNWIQVNNSFNPYFKWMVG